MSGNVELLRGVIIVMAVIGSYRIAKLEGGVSAGVKKIRGASFWVGICTAALTFIASTAAALMGKLDVHGVKLFACFLVVSAGALLLYNLTVARKKYVSAVYAAGIFLSVILLMGEEGDVLRYMLRSAVYGGYFTSALLLFSRIRYRTDESEACECFRGLPVYLLSGAFLSCALHGILKVWEKLFT